MKIGDLNIEQLLINHEYSIKFLIRYLDRLIDKNKGKINDLTKEEVKAIKESIIEDLQRDFPNMGIK